MNLIAGEACRNEERYETDQPEWDLLKLEAEKVNTKDGFKSSQKV